jgi:hypothetical protein
LTAQAEPAIKPALGKVAAQEREYRQREQTLHATVKAAVASVSRNVSANPISSFYIDVFYCQKNAGALGYCAPSIV